VPHNTIL